VRLAGFFPEVSAVGLRCLGQLALQPLAESFEVTYVVGEAWVVSRPGFFEDALGGYERGAKPPVLTHNNRLPPTRPRETAAPRTLAAGRAASAGRGLRVQLLPKRSAQPLKHGHSVAELDQPRTRVIEGHQGRREQDAKRAVIRHDYEAKRGSTVSTTRAATPCFSTTQ
jgi:hypothetical protein